MGERRTDHDRAHEQAPPPRRVPGAPSPAGQGERLARRLGNRGLGDLARLEHGEGLLAGGAVHPDVAGAIRAEQGGGAPLDRDLQARYEPALGASLDDVRVHTGPRADDLARAVSARAFVTGSDVFFAAGQYAPGTSEGNGVIAHELTHVAQQQGASPSGPMKVSEPGDASEREADAVARDLEG